MFGIRAMDGNRKPTEKYIFFISMECSSKMELENSHL
jgi:hypothetical protein